MRRPSSGPGPSSPNTPICAEFPPTVFNSINLKIRTSWAELGWAGLGWAGCEADHGDCFLIDVLIKVWIAPSVDVDSTHYCLIHSYPAVIPAPPQTWMFAEGVCGMSRIYTFSAQHTDILLAKGRARPSRQAAAHAICSEEASNISNCCGLVKNSGHASSGGLESFECISILSVRLKLSLLMTQETYTCYHYI